MGSIVPGGSDLRVLRYSITLAMIKETGNWENGEMFEDIDQGTKMSADASGIEQVMGMVPNKN